MFFKLDDDSWPNVDLLLAVEIVKIDVYKLIIYQYSKLETKAKCNDTTGILEAAHTVRFQHYTRANIHHFCTWMLKMNFIAWKKHGCFIPSHLLPFLYIGYIKTVDATYSSSRKPPSSVDSLATETPIPTLRPEGSWRSAVVEAVFSGIFASVFAQKNPKIRDFPTQKNGQIIFFKEGSVS